jgi:hypothetical protein
VAKERRTEPFNVQEQPFGQPGQKIPLRPRELLSRPGIIFGERALLIRLGFVIKVV